ncbi:MAG: hypothetical protein IK007_05670 [Lachnospiraceae bacterium]|nr:hypothetical protein [Lachnospiraceae bacterium]
MNFNKLLRTMPFILAGLIVILVTLIILGGLEDRANNNNKDNTQTADAGTPTKAQDKPVDWESDGVDINNGKNGTDKNTDPVSDPGKTDITDDPVDVTPTPDTKPVEQDNEFGFKFTEKADFVDTKNGVNLRAGASTDTAIVAHLEEGKRLERTGYNAEWTRVIYNDMECYIATSLIVRTAATIDEGLEQQGGNGGTDTAAVKFEEKSDYVDTMDGVKLRKETSTDSELVAYL